MLKIWSDIAWDEYLYWQNQDRKTLKKINSKKTYFFSPPLDIPLKILYTINKRYSRDERLALEI